MDIADRLEADAWTLFASQAFTVLMEKPEFLEAIEGDAVKAAAIAAKQADLLVAERRKRYPA